MSASGRHSASTQINHRPNLRADAAWASMQILEHGRSSREVMPQIFDRHTKAQDRAWLQELVFGILRVLPTLQSWLRELLNKPLKKQQKIIEHVIMVGLFQQAYMRTSSHAAVSETVNACKILKQTQLSGLVNAILRNFERENLAEKPAMQPHVQQNVPKWLYKKLALAYPEALDDICTAMLQRPPIFLRINTLKISTKAYSQLLDEYNIAHRIITPITANSASPSAILLKQSVHVPSLPKYEQGAFAVQDLAAQQAASLLNVQQGDIVLDACAAPGGKTAAIIESCPSLSHLYAIDAIGSRNTRTRENLARLGHDELLSDRLSILDADASDPQYLDTLPKFDRILLDAPCSATGVIRRHPDIKWHRKPADIEALVILQQRILETTWQSLKVGGTLLYATCSILPEENQEQIKRFLTTHDDASLQAINLHATKQENHAQQIGWQILPSEHNMDGFFYARLLKSDKQTV